MGWLLSIGIFGLVLGNIGAATLAQSVADRGHRPPVPIDGRLVIRPSIPHALAGALPLAELGVATIAVSGWFTVHHPSAWSALFMAGGIILIAILAAQLALTCLVADASRIVRRDLFGFTRSCPRQALQEVRLGLSGASTTFQFVRRDGSLAFQVKAHWWRDDDIRALAKFLGVTPP